MKILIVDHSKQNRTFYSQMLKDNIQDFQLIEADNAEEALFNFFEDKPDIVLSSATLPNRNGYSIAETINSLGLDVPVVIVSDNEANVVEAIRARVFDLLDRHSGKNQWENVSDKLIEYVKQKKLSKLPKQYKDNVRLRINTIDGYKLMNLDQLAYCEADGSYTNICFTDGTNNYSSYYLGKIEKTLQKYHFARISRSVLVNLKLIKSINLQKDICAVEMLHDIKYLKTSKLHLKRLEQQKII